MADHVEVLRELRTGVEMDSAYDPQGVAKMAALDAAIRALSPAGGDWVMVPREPTKEMCAAGERERLSRPTNMNPYHVWAAMLAASPQQEPVAKAKPTYQDLIDYVTDNPSGQTLAGAGGTLVAGSRGKYLYLPGVSIKSAATPKSGAVPFDVLSIASEMEAACPHYAGPDVDYSVDASKVHTWAQALRATQPATSAGTTGDALPELPEPEGEMKWTRSAGVCIRPEPGYDADQMREYARRAREVG